ncbi:class I SAM-dependent methyltransferase [Paenibacillus hubeiensis]|uniref:class I SAM-dependent methyltransferase n=1 Tax=Paenibacillus hubeiensis TaxID=3077330 RepID=UPI0031BA9DA1
MLKLATRICSVCQHTEVEVIHHQKFDLPPYHTLPRQYDVVVCTKCGFTYADTSANQHDYNDYYTNLSKYEDEEVSSGGFSSSDLARYKMVLSRVAPFLNPASTILDIGCANGGLLSYFREHGYKYVTGLDPSPKCVAFMMDHDIQAVQGDLFENTLLDKEQKYDLVIVSHVFEHLYDVAQAVTVISDYLSKDGLVYIETPNAAQYGNYFVVPYYYFDVEHINHFTDVSLANLFLQQSFSYVDSKQIEIPVAKDRMYPAVYALFKKGTFSRPYTLRVDDSAKTSIMTHLSDSNYSQINEKLAELGKSKEPCVVWGAGQNTLRLLSETVLAECNIRCFIDKDQSKQGKMMDQASITAPRWLIETAYEGTIIISSALFSKEIVSEIQGMGLSNPMIIL